MALQKPLTNFGAFVEGEAEAQDLIFALSDAVTSANIPTYTGGTETNRWEEVYRSAGDYWVTYATKTRTGVVGQYKHTDGKLYPVYKLPDWTELKLRDGSPAIDDNGFLLEVKRGVYFDEVVEGTSTPQKRNVWYGNYHTGRKIQVKQFSYVDNSSNTVFLNIPGLLVTLVDDLTKPEGVSAYAIRQVQTLSTGEVVPVNDINSFEIVTEMPGDWNYVLQTGLKYYYQYERIYDYWGDWTSVDDRKLEPSKEVYTFTERYYVADPVHYVPPQVVLKAVPTVPAGIPVREYFVFFEQPVNDYNYFDVRHGVGFEGHVSQGDSKLTYVGICDPKTVKPGATPVIIDQSKAQAMYEKWNGLVPGTPVFIPPVLTWQLDYDGVTEIASPASHFFHGRDSTTPWLPNKKRRPDYLVAYSLSVNNDRVMIVLEGDPTPNIHSYYRSFGYIGKIIPFNEYDHAGNFGITVGMGDLKTEMTGFTKNSILTDLNPNVYAKYGEYTSNGMDSLSMLRTRSNVLFQRYYPAFISQLPNYPSVGTIPPELSKLVLDKDGFQKSLWTGKYHASPIYLVHQAEGYRGFMDGVVAIYDHSLVNRDELIVDTEIPKDETNPLLGNWTEVYKFFSIKSPVNLFKHSPSPDVITVAILKEIK